ncbi:MAG: tetratricopeptide repeat protein, partial [Prevotella sp.]|nr:tetratricopeptide repeat protein [Prevotella sp.]
MRKVRFVICFIVTQLLFVASVNAQTQQELRDSLSMINRLIEQHPNAYKLKLRKAALNIEFGEWEYALDEYNKVLEIVPDNPTALYYRGYVYQHLRRFADARRDYERLLLAEPQNEHALMGLILTNLEDNRITEAFDGANRMVELFPSSAQAYAVRAEVERHENMMSPALEDIRKAIEIEDVEVQKKYPITVDDDITAYQLTAFELYMQQKDHKAA